MANPRSMPATSPQSNTSNNSEQVEAAYSTHLPGAIQHDVTYEMLVRCGKSNWDIATKKSFHDQRRTENRTNGTNGSTFKSRKDPGFVIGFPSYRAQECSETFRHLMNDSSFDNVITLKYEPCIIKLIVACIYDTIYELGDFEIPDHLSEKIVHVGVYMCAHFMGMEVAMRYALTCLREELLRKRLTLEELRILVAEYKLFTPTFCSTDMSTADTHKDVMVLLANHIILFCAPFRGTPAYQTLMITAPYLEDYIVAMEHEEKHEQSG